MNIVQDSDSNAAKPSIAARLDREKKRWLLTKLCCRIGWSDLGKKMLTFVDADQVSSAVVDHTFAIGINFTL